MTARTIRDAAAFFAGVFLLSSLGFYLAGPASATDANVTYKAVCIDGSSWRATVTVTSTWDGVSHIVVTSQQPPVTFDVPGHDTASGNLTTHGDSLTVTVSSTNAILHGDLRYTFQRPAGCVPVATTTPPTTAVVCPPGSHPDGPVSPCAVDTTVVTLIPPVSIVNTTSPVPTSPPPSVGETTGPPAAASPVAPVRPVGQLPSTGSGTTNAVIALGVVFILSGLMLARRRGAS